MADIKTRNTKKDIKIFDKASTVGDKMKNSYIRTKNNAENLADDGHNSPTEYAENNIRSAVEDVTKDTARGVKNTTKSAYKKGRELYRNHKDMKQVKQSVDDVKRTTKSADNVRRTAETTKQTIKTADKAKQTVKTTAKQTTKTLQRSVKTTQKTVKTAEQTSKAAIKTSKAAAKTAKEAAKASAKAAKAAAQAAKAAAKATVAAVKVAIKVTVAAVKAIIAGIKALVAAIAAGGWVAVVIIIVICLVALLLACFGIFFSGEDTGTGITMQTAVSEISTEYQTKIDEIKSSNTHDVVEITGLNPVWKDVMAIYAAKTSFDPDNPQEVASMDESKKELLKTVFWDMNIISSSTASKTVSVPTETVDADGNITVTYTSVTKTYLYITVTHKSTSDMATAYNFTSQQKEILNELLSEDYADLWSSVLYGITGGSKKLINVAIAQIGNSGGQPYWSWYGFGSRVEWCACFVSWCANECGYIDAGVIPKFASCDVGMNWFKNHSRWQTNTYTPREGDIIFFDWDSDGLANHVGIVEKVEDGKVHTIEGNSSDACKRLQYDSGDSRILGYGVPAY